MEIKLVGEDVGGKRGRKMVFDTSTGKTVVAKVDKIRASDWVS